MNKSSLHSLPTRGIALLITLLLISVLLGVSASLLNITLKQYQFSNIGLASEMAFQAANAGMECLMYHDNDAATYPTSKFDVNGDGSTVPEEGGISCMGAAASLDIEASNNGTVVSGEEQRFQFNWGTPAVCSDVRIYKFYNTGTAQSMNAALSRTGTNDCEQGVVCTVVRSRGYNVACPASGNFPLRTIERELTVRY